MATQILTRKQRGERIIPQDIEQINPSTFWVRSQSGKAGYSVTMFQGKWTCDCFDHKFRGIKCKHIYAVESKIFEHPIAHLCRRIQNFRTPHWYPLCLEPLGGANLTSCHAMNSKFLGFADSGNLRIVQFKCESCGCIYSVKTQTEIKVMRHGGHEGSRNLRP